MAQQKHLLKKPESRKYVGGFEWPEVIGSFIIMLPAEERAIAP
jgi:hypothetical protein